MFLEIIILMFKESTEFATLLGLLLSISNQNKVSLHWLSGGLTVGLLAAIFYALNFTTIGEWFDYAGQEIINVSLLSLIYAGLLLLCSLLIFPKLNSNNVLNPLLTITIASVVARDLTDVIIFFISIFNSDIGLINPTSSAFIGLMIGASYGVLYYYLISIWSHRTNRNIHLILLTFIAAGMLVQGIQLLMQIDWLSATKPLWNTNWLLTESSIWGRLFCAIFSYEATPTLYEVGFYFATIVFVFSLLSIKYLQIKQSSIIKNLSMPH